MTANANTPAQTPAPDVPDAKAPDQGTVPPAATPDASQESQETNVDNDIRTAEQRIADKQTYLAGLAEKMPDLDRAITAQQQQNKMAADRNRPVEQPAAENTQPVANTAQAPATGLPSGEHFIELLKEDPDKAMVYFAEASDKRTAEALRQYVPRLVEEVQMVNQHNSRLDEIRTELGEEDFPRFLDQLAVYRNKGYSPTLDHVLNDFRYGTPATQQQTMQLGREYAELLRMRKEAEGQPADPGQQQPQNLPGRQFPIAPGGGKNTAPQGGQRTKQTLADLWPGAVQ